MLNSFAVVTNLEVLGHVTMQIQQERNAIRTTQHSRLTNTDTLSRG